MNIGEQGAAAQDRTNGEEQAASCGKLLAHLEIAVIAMEEAIEALEEEGLLERERTNLRRAADRARSIVTAEQQKIRQALDEAPGKPAGGTPGQLAGPGLAARLARIEEDLAILKTMAHPPVDLRPAVRAAMDEWFRDMEALAGN